MSLLQGNDARSDEEGSDVDLQASRRRPSPVLAGVVGSALLGAVCLGLGGWYRPPVTPVTPEPSVPEEDDVTPAPTTSTSTLPPWILPRAYFHAPDDQIELGSPIFGETTGSFFEVREKNTRWCEEEEYVSTSLPPKGEGLAGLAAFYRAATMANGYAQKIPSVMDAVTYDDQYGVINFMLGEVRAPRRKRIQDWATLKLPSEQRDMLLANPSGFIKKYGHFFVSQMIYGVGFAAQCSIDSSRAKQYAINDLHDVFSESGPNLGLPGSFYASNVTFYPGPRSETEKSYAKWKAEADKIRPLRPVKVDVAPFVDVVEIREIVEGLPVEQRKLFEVPHYFKTETLGRLVDEKTMVQYVISAVQALPATCEKTQLHEEAKSYRDRLFYTDIAVLQAETNAHGFFFFKGSDLLESLWRLMQKCSSRIR